MRVLNLIKKVAKAYFEMTAMNYKVSGENPKP